MIKVLLGEISSYKAIVIGTFLKKNYEVYIISYDHKGFTSHFHTKFTNKHIVIPHVNREKYIEALSNYCIEEDIDIFIPVHSDYIGPIIKKKEAFGRAIDYIGSYDDYSQLHDKDHLMSLAKSLGIDIPAVYESFDKAQLPFVVKPRNKSSAKGVRYVFTEFDRKKFERSITAEDIFQEYVEGFGCGFSVYVNQGKIIESYGHKRLAEYPISGGSSVYRQEFYDERMLLVANKILSKIKWTGFAMIEFKFTPEDRLVLIEVNPRIWGSMNQGLQNGVNFFDSILGECELKVNSDCNTFLSPQLYLSLMEYVLKGNFKPVLEFIKNRSINKPDVDFLRDPYGYLSILFRKIFS